MAADDGQKTLKQAIADDRRTRRCTVARSNAFYIAVKDERWVDGEM